MKILSISLTLASCAFADTLYVNNDSSQPADFRTVQEAHDAATAGDTLIVAPSAISYGSPTITKRLIIRGSGFGAAENSLQRSSSRRTIFSTLTIGDSTDRTAGAGTLIEGVEISSLTFEANQCILSRSLVNSVSIDGSLCSITQCYLDDLNLGPAQTIPITVQIKHTVIDGNTSGGSSNLDIWGNVAATFDHCVFNREFDSSDILPASDLQITNSIIQSTPNITDPIIFNSLIFQDPSGGFISINENFTGTREATFVDPQGRSLGAEFAIKADSAALTAAADGGQVGIFGGDTPFIVGAFPAIPRIIDFKIRSASTVSGITFEVKAEAQK